MGHRLGILYFCRPIQGMDCSVDPSVTSVTPCKRWMRVCPSVASVAQSRRWTTGLRAVPPRGARVLAWLSRSGGGQQQEMDVRTPLLCLAPRLGAGHGGVSY